MSLLSGPVSVTRLRVVSAPPSVDFEQRGFRAIAPGSELRQSVGFVPFAEAEPGDYALFAPGSCAFRVRVDTLRPDPVLLKDRYQQLLATERANSGDGFVSAKVRRRLKSLAHDELIVAANPSVRVTEAVILGGVLWLGSTADGTVGLVQSLLRDVGVVTDYGPSPIEDGVPYDLGAGAKFLAAMVEAYGDPGAPLTIEPVSGAVKLAKGGDECVATLSGELLPDLIAMLDRGYEMVSASLMLDETPLRLDAQRWAVTGLKLQPVEGEDWRNVLEARVQAIAEVFERLDGVWSTVFGRPRAAVEST